MDKRIESLLESVFEKVSSQKLKYTVHSPNKQKFGEAAGDALTEYPKNSREDLDLFTYTFLIRRFVVIFSYLHNF